MTAAMLLRFIHSVLEGHARQYGAFKIRGSRAQFTAALILYQLLLKCEDNQDPKIDWAIHNLCEALLCANGLDDHAISYPTDQVIFLYSALSDHYYRIPDHVRNLLSQARYCFRCISIHVARIQVRGDREQQHLFFDEIPGESINHELDVDDDGDLVLDMAGDEEHEEHQCCDENLDVDGFLKCLDSLVNGDDNGAHLLIWTVNGWANNESLYC